MHYDVTSCVICLANNVEYLEKEGSYKNYTKEVTLRPLSYEVKSVRVCDISELSWQTGTALY